MVTRCAALLSDTYERIRRQMILLGLIHCDETGTRVDGKTWWVHNASNPLFTFLSINTKRGQIGMDAAGILPNYHGITVHDCWGSYWKFTDCIHAICCAHLLRELNGVEENHPEQTWATKFRELLLAMKKVKDKSVDAEKEEVSYYLFISLINSMMKSSNRHMKKIHYLKSLPKSMVARKRPKY